MPGAFIDEVDVEQSDQHAASVDRPAANYVAVHRDNNQQHSKAYQVLRTCYTPALRTCSRRRSKRATLMSRLAVVPELLESLG